MVLPENDEGRKLPTDVSDKLVGHIIEFPEHEVFYDPLLGRETVRIIIPPKERMIDGTHGE